MTEEENRLLRRVNELEERNVVLTIIVVAETLILLFWLFNS